MLNVTECDYGETNLSFRVPPFENAPFFGVFVCYAVLKCKISIDLFGKNILLYHNIQLLPSKYYYKFSSCITCGHYHAKVAW